MLIKNIFILCALFLASFTAHAEGPLGTLSISMNAPPVNSSALRDWKKDFFGSEEIWIIKDVGDFLNQLRSSGLSDSHFNEILNQIKYQLPSDKLTIISEFQTVKDAKAFLWMPEALKKTLPKVVLQTAYAYLLKTDHLNFCFSFNSKDELSAWLSSFRVSDQVRNDIFESIVVFDGQLHIIFTPDLWPKLNDQIKSYLISFFRTDRPYQLGLSIDITIKTGDDIEEISQKYAGDRDPKILERYINLLLSRSSTGEIQIPLSKILHPFIRKHINTYASCTGPNCFNSGLSVNEGNSYRQENVFADEQLFERVSKKYRFVKPNEQMQSGDLLAYRNAAGKLVHVSTYIANEIVYTKNGLSKFSPYIFQTKSQNEDLYFPNGKYLLMVFRVPGRNETVHREDLYSSQDKEIYYTDKAPERFCRDLFREAS